MPKAPTPKPPDRPDNRTLVDRVLDRIKNNRVAAAVILVALGLGALASLTDSARKLTELAASFGGSPRVAGEWKTDPALFYPHGLEPVRLHLTEPAAGQIVGFVQFGGNDDLLPRHFPILEGKRDGKLVQLVFDSGYQKRETFIGDLAGDELRLVYRWPGRGAVAATARRIPQQPQLVSGRMALLYKGQEYPGHREACTQMLQALDPPERYRLSEPPDEFGHVRCAGFDASGKPGFDMMQNSVRLRILCPPQSRSTLVDGRVPEVARGCECDGDLVAAGAVCK